MISGLNDRLTMRVLDLVKVGFDLSGVGVCWLGLGSEGRAEQTIATDQDNAIVFLPDDAGVPEAAVRERLVPFAHAVNEALDRCGYPLCAGDVMAGNARWCLSLDEWIATFAGWIDRGDGEALLGASIFFDFRPLWGASHLAQSLRADVTPRAVATPRFRKQMSDNARRRRPPLSWRGEIKEAEDAIGGCTRQRPSSASRRPTSPTGAIRSNTCRCCGCACSISATRTSSRRPPIRISSRSRASRRSTAAC
jgi:signal-transduction protein with cAMP-binding, CBS, and nucleotidyltransferase domain